MSTELSSWAKTKQMVLPSENVIELKRVALAELIATGCIPDTLSAMAAEVATRERMQMSKDDLVHYVEVINQVVIACAVSPKVTLHGGADSLAVSDIDYVDRLQIFSWANGVATALRPFRDEAKAIAAQSGSARKSLRG